MQPADIAAANRSRQPTAELSTAIQATHAAIASEPEPEDKAALTQALQTLMKVQAKNMAEQGGGLGMAAGR